MHTEKREDPLVELGYEIRDLNTKAIRVAAIGFFLFAIGSAVVGFWIFRVMNPAGFAKETTQHRILPEPPNPLIQSNMTAKTDIMDIRQHEDAILNGPIQWANPQKTKLRIPIDQAMQIIAERGMPKVNANVPAVSKGHTPDANIGEKAAPGTAPLGTPPVNMSSPNPATNSVAPATTTPPVTAPPTTTPTSQTKKI